MNANAIDSFGTMNWEEKALALWNLQGLELELLGPSRWCARVPQTVVGLPYPGSLRIVNAIGTSVPKAIEALWEEVTSKLKPEERLIIYNSSGQDSAVRWSGGSWSQVS